MSDSNIYSLEAPARTPIHPVDCSEGPGIDFDVVAKKEDVDLLRDAVLEIVAFIDATDEPNTATVIGPACTKLRRKQNEEKP